MKGTADGRWETEDRQWTMDHQPPLAASGRRSSVVRRLGVMALVAVLTLVSCQRAPASPVPLSPLNDAPATVSRVAFPAQATCTQHFVAHDLDFSTGARMRTIAMYASNGAGLAANDLNGDGLIDLVFASVDGPSAILWNRGALNFEKQTLDDMGTRAVNTVDVDGDGLLDIVFTHRANSNRGGVSYWRNLNNRRFERGELPGVSAIAYAMAWADLNGDQSLDLVTGSYNAEFKKEGVDPATVANRAGVFLHEQRSNGFAAQRLTEDSQALSIGLVDLNGDGKTDIWTANDFALQDGIWLRQDQGWQATRPMPQTSHSTMSIDWGDVDNTGKLAAFTTDMNPYDTSTQNMAAWLPMMAATDQSRQPDDRQIMANVLLTSDGKGNWQNEAAHRGIDASGWSWAGRFGDLDQDGLLDLYIVNGMIAKDLFGHLPNDELVEKNRAYHNNGAGMFELATGWGLDSERSGRGMVMADLDNDGDLDIVVNNLRGLAQLFENQLCAAYSLQVELNWRGVGNTHAIGAQLALQTDKGIYRRDVRASAGYLSGDPTRVHFGYPIGAHPIQLQIMWPDGRYSQISAADLLQSNALLRIQR